MTGKDPNEWFDEAKRQAHEFGLRAALAAIPEVKNCVVEGIPTVFGERWQREFDRIREQLMKHQGPNFEGRFQV
jgi:hypothetical protein